MSQRHTHDDDSSFLRHIACPSCGSSDANAVYTDGHTYCHICQAYGRDSDSKGGTDRPRLIKEAHITGLLTDLTFGSLPFRRLTEESCTLWGYGQGKTNQGKNVQVAQYKAAGGGPWIAQKIRTVNKEFSILGDAKQMPLYGQWLWKEGGKKLVITEGEIDAITVSQVQNHKWPVVSLPNGAQAALKAISKNLEWVESFDEVVLMFDMDEPGQAAAKEVAELLKPGKAKIAVLPLKDANELLKADRGPEIIQAMWNAKSFRPDGIIAGTDLKDRIKTFNMTGDALKFPWEKLQNRTHGYRAQEIIMFAAGSGVGKSELVNQIAYDALMNQGETLGYIALEEPVERTGLRFMSLYTQKRLHLDKTQVSPEEFDAAYVATVGNGRLFLYDHFGSMESDHLLNKIRFMVAGCGCRSIVLDHISIVVSDMEDDGHEGERKMIDRVMTRIRSLVQELKFRLLLICHLKKADGTPHEEGGRVTLDDLRGSGSLKQLSDTIVAFERNQQDEARKHWTMARCLKCRWTGDTGECDWLLYDQETGLVHPGEPAFDEEVQVEGSPKPASKEGVDYGF